MTVSKISVAELGGAIAEYLHTYDKEVNTNINKIARSACSDLVKKTKQTAPVGKRQKHYRDSIAMKSKSGRRYYSYIWYVKGSDYRLSHLLEHGHALRNGGRTRATHFIENASTPILEEYVNKVEEVIRNG